VHQETLKKQPLLPIKADSPSDEKSRSDRRATLSAIIVIVFAAVAVYYNSFYGVFVYDDELAILKNPTIRHLWPLSIPLSPPLTRGGITVVARPLLNISFALNYTISGTGTWSYHLFNFIIHVLACLLLFGIVRRTLLMPRLYRRFGPAAWTIGLLSALLWTVHPLQTESVTYIVQRAESLAGMLYLLTLYCFIRAAGAGSATHAQLRWYACTIAACFLGTACKEVIASAPLIVMLYDRTFVAGSFREAWRLRRGLYLGLAGTWLMLAWLVVSANGPRAGAAGFGIVSPLDYALTQCKAIILYLKLSFWPYPLVIDYGFDVVKDLREVWWQGTIVMLLITGTIIALRRCPALGFLGAWFFMILAPSSSVVPIVVQTMAEHRMYLPLAAVIVLAATGLYQWAGKRFWVAIVPLAIVMGWLTVQRNRDFASELGLWSKTVMLCPKNARTHLQLGNALYQAGRLEQAADECGIALRILPDYAQAHCSLGWILANMGKRDEAIGHYREALRFKPDYADAHMNLGIELIQAGRMAEAIGHFEEAVRLQPDNPQAHGNLGCALVTADRLPEAVEQFQEVLRIDPSNGMAKKDLRNALDLVQEIK